MQIKMRNIKGNVTFDLLDLSWEEVNTLQHATNAVKDNKFYSTRLRQVATTLWNKFVAALRPQG